MNGWAKVSGALSVVAGIVFILAIAAAMSDGCDFGDCSLECFACNDYFEHIAFVAGIIAAIAGVIAICGGVSKNLASASILGISLSAIGLVMMVIPLIEDVSAISWNTVDVLLAIVFIILAAVEVACNAKNQKYGIAFIALILAFCVEIAYLLDLCEGMVVPVLGGIIILLGGLSLLAVRNMVFEDEAAEVSASAVEERVVVPAPAPVAANPYVAPAPKEEAKPAPAKAAAKAPAKEESELDKLLAQGWAVAVAKSGEDKANEMSDSEIMAVVSAEDPELYAKLSALTGITVAAPAKAEAKPAAAKTEAAPAKEESELDKLLAQGWAVAVAKSGEDKANEMSDSEIMAVVSAEDPELYAKLSALTGITVAAPAKEESELDKLLAQGWAVAVKSVGEERANEMSDYEIMAVISIEDPELYAKLSALTGIVVATGDEDVEAGFMDADAEDEFDFELEPDTPAGLLRRACWNKGLRCRKMYGPHEIPVAFVKSKVAVFIDADKADHSKDDVLKAASWVVLHFKESKITDGEEEAQVVYDAVKENLRALKKAKKPRAKKKR